MILEEDLKAMRDQIRRLERRYVKIVFMRKQQPL